MKSFKNKNRGLKSRKIVFVLLFFFFSTLIISSRADALIKIVSTFIDMLGNDIYNVGNLNATGWLNSTNFNGTYYGDGSNLIGVNKGTVWINMINHYTALEEIVGNIGQWQTGATGSATYGRTAHYLNFTEMGTPTSAQLVIVYIYSAAGANINNVSITVNAAPDDGGTVMTPFAEQAAFVMSTTYPQTIFLNFDPSQFVDGWYQLVYQLATANVGPDIFSADLVLYYG